MKKIFILCCIASILAGCKRSKIKSDLANCFSWENAQEAERLFDSPVVYDFIALENDPASGFSGAIGKITYSAGKYFVLDGPRASKRLFIFDSRGKIVSKIDKRGRGPEEYLSIADFSVRKDTVFILDNSKDRLVEYDLQGNHLRSRHIDITIPSSICATDYGFLIHRKNYRGDENKEGYAIFLLDQNLKIFDKKLPYSEDAPQLSYEAPFVETDDFVVFNQMLWSSIQVFDRKTPVMTEYNFDFGNRRIPGQDMGRTERVFENKNRYTFIASVPVFLKSSLIGKISDRDRILNYNLDTETGSVIFNDGSDLPLYPGCFFQKDDDAIVIWLDRFQYEKSPHKPGLPAKYLNHLKNDGVILMTASLQ